MKRLSGQVPARHRRSEDILNENGHLEAPVKNEVQSPLTEPRNVKILAQACWKARTRNPSTELQGTKRRHQSPQPEGIEMKDPDWRPGQERDEGDPRHSRKTTPQKRTVEEVAPGAKDNPPKSESLPFGP